MYQDSKRLSPQRFKRFKLDGQAVQLVGMFAWAGQLAMWCCTSELGGQP
jgi:hypothetical protein